MYYFLYYFLPGTVPSKGGCVDKETDGSIATETKGYPKSIADSSMHPHKKFVKEGCSDMDITDAEAQATEAECQMSTVEATAIATNYNGQMANEGECSTIHIVDVVVHSKEWEVGVDVADPNSILTRGKREIKRNDTEP